MIAGLLVVVGLVTINEYQVLYALFLIYFCSVRLVGIPMTWGRAF